MLSGRDYRWFRDFLRAKYLIRAVVSLPGDAFQRSKARVKTSFVVLEKRRREGENQPAVFMYGCQYVGNDDPSRERVLPQDRHVRDAARNEIREVLEEYGRFQDGDGNLDYLVRPERLEDRLDVKYCLMRPGHMSAEWAERDIRVLRLSQIVDLKAFVDEDVILCQAYEGIVTILASSLRWAG